MSRKNYFSFAELVTTDTGLTNLPTDWKQLVGIAEMWYNLNIIRDKYGEPIIVNSAYRTKEVNEKVKGDKNSFHLQGRAADIRPAFYPAEDYYVRLEKLISTIYDNKTLFKEIIPYSTFIHIAI